MDKPHRLFLVAAATALAASIALAAQAQDVPESLLSCIATGTKVGHTWIQHSDPARLQEAVKVFESGAPAADYPEGTVIRLIPQEAMIKRSRTAFANTNGWEYFALTVTPQGTTVRERGETASNRLGTCQSCHSKAAKFDYVCRSGHDCPIVSLTEQQIAALQANDPRCPK
jgi:Cytochrome P460